VAAVVCALAMLGGYGLGQRSQQNRSGLRALSLLEVAANGQARLVPVAILVNGKFYDASLYRADPRPMALDPETVYEATRNGSSVGLFTVTNAAKFKEVWIGVGQWRPNEAQQEKKAKTADQQSESKRPGESDDRPILRKPQAGGPGRQAEPAATGEQRPESREAMQGRADSEDVPERPTLRRGKPAQMQAGDEIAPVTAQKPGATQKGAAPAANGADGLSLTTLPAISDASGPEPRSYAIALTEAERSAFQSKARAMAYQAIQKYAAGRPQHKPGSASELNETAFHVFDVHNNNEPVVVWSGSVPEAAGNGKIRTAAAPGSGFEYYVTVVARRDLYGEVRQLFAQVTDTSHLDVYPRMELIDAVDAEGSGSGQLLFRQISDSGYSYSLYRAGLDKLWRVFVSTSRSY
jgi:hypothetical protein